MLRAPLLSLMLGLVAGGGVELWGVARQQDQCLFPIDVTGAGEGTGETGEGTGEGSGAGATYRQTRE